MQGLEHAEYQEQMLPLGYREHVECQAKHVVCQAQHVECQAQHVVCQGHVECQVPHLVCQGHVECQALGHEQACSPFSFPAL